MLNAIVVVLEMGFFFSSSPQHITLSSTEYF